MFKSSGNVETFARDAGQSYSHAIDLGQEDLRLRALKYPLLRLIHEPLHEQDRLELAQLAGLALAEGDVAPVAEAIQHRKSSPIAVAIAGVVLSARGSKWKAMLGAVIGAHAARGASAGSGDVGFEVLGAIIGAASLQSHDFLQQIVGNDWKAFVERDV
jgi:hypothetical protein